MSFRIRGLEAGQFSHLFALSEAELAAQGALGKSRTIHALAASVLPMQRRATKSFWSTTSITRSRRHTGCVLRSIRQGEKTFDAVDAVRDQLRRRTLAVRGFDDKAMMTGWEVIEGIWLEGAIERQFTDPRTHYLHIHFAAPGCFAAKVDRV